MKNFLNFGKKVGSIVGNEVKTRADDTINEMRSTMMTTIKMYSYIGAAIGIAVLTLLGIGIYKLVM